MLEAIREKAQGWIAWAIVILITIPFALWGIQQYLGGGREPEVASVNGQPITQRELDIKTRNLQMNMRERLGDAYRPGMFDPKLLRAKTLDSMIRSTLLAEHSRDLGLGVSNAEVVATIQSLPLFQVGGHFSREAYRQGLRLQGMTSQGFEEQVRKSLVSTQIADAISGSAFVTPAMLADYIRLADQRRDFAYLRVKAADFNGQVKVDEAEIESWYESHPEQFVQPERVKIEYIDFAIGSLKDRIEVDDRKLRDYYEQNIERYKRPEQRRVSHILIQAGKDASAADKAAAKQQAEAIYQQLKQGADFPKLAREKSQDVGSAQNGGDLGILEPGTLGNAFDQVAFKLEPGEISPPVETEFGYHIIEVTKVIPGGSASFESVKGKVEAAYRKEQAEKQFYDQAEKLSELTYQNPDSLEPAAEAMGLKIEQSDWLTRDGGSGVLASPKIATAAFSDDVLSEGNNSEAIELGPEHVLVLRVVDHEEQGTKPLAEVKEGIRAQLVAKKAAGQAHAVAEKLLQEHRAGKPLAELAKEGKATLENPGALKRVDPKAPRELLDKVFELPRPEKGKPATTLVELANGDAVIVELRSVSDGDIAKLSDAERKQLTAALSRAYGDKEFEDYIQWLRDNAEIVVKSVDADTEQ